MVKINKQLGVTLIELIIVVGIVSVVSSVLLFNYSDFSSNASIRNISQEVALSIRKAQSYATSVRGLDPYGGGAQSYPAYGIAFSVTDATAAEYYPSRKNFIIFADLNIIGDLPNKKYETNNTCGSPALGNECLESFTINSSDNIVGIQIDRNEGFRDSGSLYITFRRPTPDAVFCFIPSGQTDCISTAISDVKIKLRSSKGRERVVSVWNTGQISVE